MSVRQVITCILDLVVASLMLPTCIQSAQVTGHFDVAEVKGANRSRNNPSVVVWLVSQTGQGGTVLPERADAPHAQLVQKNKTFDPHLVVVRVGSQVDFPNRDPFFHNVFSLFNGKRFDLGLYEAGSTRGVRFDRPGICYIFCNIHPQMSAVVVVVDTPYFAISRAGGEASIPGVPPGQYLLKVWEERCAPRDLQALSHQITIGETDTTFGNIQLRESREPVEAHLNKYGKPYDPEVFSSPIYMKP